MQNFKIKLPCTEELEEYLSELLEENGFEEGQFTDDSVPEIREILLDYIMDNLEVEVV